MASDKRFARDLYETKFLSVLFEGHISSGEHSLNHDYLNELLIKTWEDEKVR